MRYLSLDLETTGLDESVCEVLEIGAVYVDDSKSFKNWPRFSALIKRDTYRGQPLALNMHRALFETIALSKPMDRIEEKSHITGVNYQSTVMLESMAVLSFSSWFERHHSSSRNCTLAGKNIGMFDAKFLRRLELFPMKRFHHRVLDPGNLWLRPSDEEIPNTDECCKRAELDFGTTHRAVEDAEIVALLIQKARGINNFMSVKKLWNRSF